MRNGYQKSFGVTQDAWIEDRLAGAAWRLLCRSTRERPISMDSLGPMLAAHLNVGEGTWHLDRGHYGDLLDDLEADLARDALVFHWEEGPPSIGEEEALKVLSDDPTCTADGLMRLMERCGALLPFDVGRGKFARFGNPPALSRPHEVGPMNPKDARDVDAGDHRSLSPPKFDPLNLRSIIASKREPWKHPDEQRHLLFDDLHLEIEDIFTTFLEDDREDSFAQPRKVRVHRVRLKNANGTHEFFKVLVVPWAAAWRTYRLLHVAMSLLIRLAAPATPRLASTAMREAETTRLADRSLGVPCDGWTETGSPLADAQMRMVLDRQRRQAAAEHGKDLHAHLRDLLPADGELACPGILQSLFLARGFIPLNTSEALTLFVTEAINAALPADTAGPRFAAASRPTPQESCAGLLAAQIVRLYLELNDHPLHVCENDKCRNLFVRQTGSRTRAARPGLNSRTVTPVSRHGTGVMFCSTTCGVSTRVARKRARDKST